MIIELRTKMICEFDAIIRKIVTINVSHVHVARLQQNKIRLDKLDNDGNDDVMAMRYGSHIYFIPKIP